MSRAARLALAYHRFSSASTGRAIAGFSAWLRDEIRRFAALGPTGHAALLALEATCAEAGVSFPKGDGATVPWRLPVDLLDLPVEALPAQPLIAPAELASAVRPILGPRARAIDALTLLLSDGLPDDRWARLNACSAAGTPRRSPDARVAVCLHAFHPEIWPSLHRALAAIPERWDLIVTVPRFASTGAYEQIKADCPSATFVPCANRGRDVLPFLRVLSAGLLDRYDAVCKLHTKVSPHMSRGSEWRDALVTCLVGSPSSVARTLDRFRAEPDLGLLGPDSALVGAERSLGNLQNRHWAHRLAGRLGIAPDALERPFFAGTMFWCRPAALGRLRSVAWTDSDFPIEMRQTDGTPAHAIERLIWPCVEAGGYRIGTIRPEEAAPPD